MFLNMKILSGIVLALGIVFTGYVHADYQTAKPTANSAVVNKVPDQELATQIAKKIGPGTFTKGYEKVTFAVKDGVVTLGGSVKTMGDKEKVEKEVRDIKGVEKLNSNIAIEDAKTLKDKTNDFPMDRAATPADEQLNKKIRDNVSKGVFMDSYKEVVLKTANGIVILEGFVAKEGDQEKLILDIKKIDGVADVKSNLQVKK